MLRRHLLVIAALAALAAALPSTAQQRSVLVATVDGPINPVVAEYIAGSIDKAESDPSVEALVIRMDTPGGLDTSMRQIIKKMQGAAVPVIVYVAPSGSRAASAGAFITIAADIAAMAPGTNIGAASPVSMGGGGMDKTMQKKVMNDAAAYIRSIAEAHGRNADLAEDFVRKGASVSETEALEKNVVDLLADDLPALLAAVDGRTVKTVAGEKTLATADVRVERKEMTWRQRVFNALANPNVAYILMMLGFYGLFFELSNPGAIFPGVIGAICLILAFYSLQTLPINFAGALLILLSIVLFMLEIWVTSFGILTIGGITALVIGSLMLIEAPEDYMRISLSVIIPTALLTAGFFTVLLGSAARAQFRKVATGWDAMVGLSGMAETEIKPGKPGRIMLEGELWKAVSETGTIKPGDRVEVVSASGLTVTVKPAAQASEEG
ncbi:MAG: NfeD family protein [Candidatus Nitrospinota bacterium M3_3B_026]